ncbi:MAG: glycosyltransferase family 4 protein [Treponema sp.]|jgi:glycosyltransferase involved in cell wall biosynthesis|nr:glycosyltransferase family 4 protein [Treponema sp.]
MTILGIFLNNQLRTGGNRRYLELMEELSIRGNTVHVIMNSFLDYSPKAFNKIEVSIKYKRRSFPPASYLFRQGLKRHYIKIKDAAGSPQFIIIFGDTQLKSALFLKKKLELPLFYAFRANDIDRARIMRNHGSLEMRDFLFSLLYEPVNRHREKKAARHAELITFQNTVDRDCFLRRTKCPVKKTVVIPGNLGSWYGPKWENRNCSSEIRKIVYIGLLSAGKGFWELLKALELLKKRGYGFLKCYALGRLENTDPVLRLIKKLHIEEMVFLEGFRDPFPYLADCDLLVYPTLYDAFPNTVLEALHAGCPVIASAVGGVPDLLGYEELLFKSADIGQMTDKIERCITDRDFYKKIRMLCSERAEVHRFDWAERFESAMRNYLAADGTPEVLRS